MIIDLQFANGDVSRCEALGSLYMDRVSYAVFCDKANKDIYIYKYTRKKNKIKLFPINDKREFGEVCKRLNMIVNDEKE